MNNKKFARSNNVAIFGVCAGLADYIGINVMVMRVLWVIFAVFTEFFLAVVLYAVLAFVMSAPDGTPEAQRFWHGLEPKKIATIFCITLISIGLYMIITAILNINLGQYMFPIGLILGGGLLLAWAFKGKGK